MYNTSLIVIVTKNLCLYNGYIPTKIFIIKKIQSEHTLEIPATPIFITAQFTIVKL
jgi:hypothetical protein